MGHLGPRQTLPLIRVVVLLTAIIFGYEYYSDRNLIARSQNSPGQDGGSACSAACLRWLPGFPGPIDVGKAPLKDMQKVLKGSTKLNNRALVGDPVLWGDMLLDPVAIQRGIHSLGETARLRRVVRALLAGENVTVVVVGSSISGGAGASLPPSKPGVEPRWPPFPNQIENWLKAAFPKANARVVNLGQGAATTHFWESCGRLLIPEDAAIVILELSINTWQPLDSSFHTAYERLVRHVLKMKSNPAVVALNTYALSLAGGFPWSLEAGLTVYNAYYGVPELSFRNAIYHLQMQNQTGYKAYPARKNALNSTEPGELLYWDDVHPYGPTGHRYLAELFIGLIQITAKSVLLSPFVEAEARSSAQPIPPPMIKGNYEHGDPTCYLNGDFKKVVKATQGFEWRNERDTPVEALQKWGYISETPGATLSLQINTLEKGTGGSEDTAQAEASDTAGLRTVAIGHLASYQGMGRGLAECVAGCKCENSSFDGHWDKRYSTTVMASLQVSQHPACEIRVTVLPESSTGANKVKLTGVVVTAPTSWEFTEYAEDSIFGFADKKGKVAP